MRFATFSFGRSSLLCDIVVFDHSSCLCAVISLCQLPMACLCVCESAPAAAAAAAAAVLIAIL